MTTITQTFNPAIGEYGQDYAVPVHTPIYSPVSGTFSSVDNGKKAWGKQAFVHLKKAIGGVSTFSVGHLTAFTAVDGQYINAGDQIGWSGGASSDPSSGVSTGPHVEPQFYDAAFKPINPVSVFAQFASWEAAIFGGKGGTPASTTVASTGGGNSVGDVVASLTGIPQAIGDAVSSVESLAVRAFWFMAGFALFVVGLILIFRGDIESVAKAGAQAAGKASKTAAAAAELAA